MCIPTVPAGARKDRLGLDKLMIVARRGLFNVVVVWRFDPIRPQRQTGWWWRWRSSAPLGLISCRTRRHSIHSTPMGTAMFTIIAAMAELEREYYSGNESLPGLDHARRNRTRSGQPCW